jgi:GT2 family glycosyltransferase
MVTLDWVLAALALPCLAAALYLSFLAGCSLWPARAEPASRRQRFLFVVPAHNEAAGIARTVLSLLAVRYPVERRRVMVVADNCDDDTALRATDAGARVLRRHDPRRRGKGYALAKAFGVALHERWADALVVIDADTEVNADFLEALSARLDRGALAVQAGSGVLNPRDSWRTELMALAISLFNGVRSLGRERLGLSCGLRGNGMCLTLQALQRHPYDAFSVVEDLEYGISLGLAGVRVHYAHEATVRSAMVSSGEAAASQRRRWEGGRAALARVWRSKLLRAGLRAREPLLIDLALDLFVPPLSRLGVWLALGLIASVGAAAATGGKVALASWASASLLLMLYVLRGLALSGVGAGVLLAVPRYVRWKRSLGREQAPAEWIRTAREEVAR